MELNILYNPKKSPEEIQVLVDLWHEDLGHLSNRVFSCCVAAVRKTSRFFPVISDILSAYDEVIAEMARDSEQRLRLVYDNGPILSPDENRRMAAELREKLEKIGKTI